MSTLAVNTITDVAGSLPPVFPAGSAQLNPLADREDKIINGDFGVWQRGTSFTTNSYGTDRWINNINGGTVTQARAAFSLGEFEGLNAVFYPRQTVSGQTLAAHYANSLHRVESVRSYSGQTITVLGWARRNSGTGNMAVDGEQVFGTGGSPSAAIVAISPTTITLTGSWAPFAVVMTVPSIASKTLGTNGNDYFGLSFWTSAGSDFNARTNSLGLQTIAVDFWGIHIRRGTWTSAATADYRPRDPGTELALCQRYYEKSYDIATAPGTNTGAAASIEDLSMPTSSPLRVRFAVSKRAVPAMTVYDAAGTVNRVTAWIPAQTNGQSLSALDNFGNSGFKAFLTAVGLTRLAFHWTADAEI